MQTFTRDMRTIGTRDHFDWSANGDSLPELEPVYAEELQREPAPVVTIRFGLLLAAFAAGIITHHVIWSASL